MNGDNLKLGQLLTEERPRDAVHIAVVPMVAGAELWPGEHAKLIDGKAVGSKIYKDTVGVVDPFLRKNVQEGQRFWLFLLPGSITSLRHDWTHPAFPLDTAQAIAAAEARANAEAFLRAVANSEGIDYHELLDCAVCGDQRTVNWDCHVTMDDEFWRHVETVSGKTFSEGHRENTYFSCAC